MADGTIVAAGGFDPILAFWNADGTLVNEWDDGPEAVPSDPVTGLPYDTNLILANLAAGSYFATIAQYSNFAVSGNYADGFIKSDPFFTATDGCSNGQFCDVTGDNRTSFWAFDILNVESASTPPSAVPLPAGLPLLIGALGGLAAVRRKKKS